MYFVPCESVIDVVGRPLWTLLEFHPTKHQLTTNILLFLLTDTLLKWAVISSPLPLKKPS
jgi:hypothetical protein